MLWINQAEGAEVMIFASDLDRTLIYSNRAIEELGRPGKTMLKPVERKDDKWISFMTTASFSMLEEINRRFLFIPITTRTTNQFNRIFIFKKEIPLTYAITSNGGHILYKGEEVEEWSAILSAKLQKDVASNKEVQDCLKKKEFRLSGLVKQVEDLFFYFILENSLSSVEINEISNSIMSFGWRISLQGRKLYFIPKAINKGTALEYICNTERLKVITGAGDSNLDWDFLKHCPNRHVPIHGELASNDFITSCSVTKNSGILAGEEILQESLSLLSIQI
jgi:hydroxymethylpyrimidine pyrophosphatase-like HAD family hydrolase